MSGEPQMFRINPGSRASEKITGVEFSRLGWMGSQPPGNGRLCTLVAWAS